MHDELCVRGERKDGFIGTVHNPPSNLLKTF